MSLDIKIEVCPSLKADEWYLISPGFKSSYQFPQECEACGGLGQTWTTVPNPKCVEVRVDFCLQCRGTGRKTVTVLDGTKIVHVTNKDESR